MPQTGSNDEKNGVLKSCCTVPLREKEEQQKLVLVTALRYDWVTSEGNSFRAAGKMVRR